jgi:hypothetical protein
MSQPDAALSGPTDGAPAAATVIWWREDAERRVYDLLEVGPGPQTSAGDVWPRQLVQSPATNGGWGVASLPRLGRLTAGLTAQLRPPIPLEPEDDGSLSVAVLDRTGDVIDRRSRIASDPLYDDCRREAIDLLARRLRQRTVRTDPLSAGSLLVRIRIDGDRLLLDLAPAVASGRTGVTGIPVVAITPGLHAGGQQRFSDRNIDPHELEPSPAEFDVTLDQASEGIGALPGIILPLPVDRIDGSAGAVLARVELEMPLLNYPALEQRWPERTPWGRRCYVVVNAPAWNA